jgi:A/G-specific adenine glycosylase
MPSVERKRRPRATGGVDSNALAAPAVVGAASFATRVLEWFGVHGRHDLPWQHPRTPYRVWLSEVMLQQTQVATVIPYFECFVRELPDLRALAQADDDRVLALWAGLGYYSRARNLHRAARLCVERHGGELPADFESLAALPGIDRSTAGAILAQAHGTRLPILDGNVRRVLARHAGIDGDVQSAAVQRALWALSESLLPHARMAEYTQAIMDLGATVCRRAAPRCDQCAVATDCVALREGLTAELPRRKVARALATRETTMLVLRDDNGRVLLQRRPPSGIWGGLWSLPECATGADVASVLAHEHGLRARTSTVLPPFMHVFTHFRLQVRPIRIEIDATRTRVADNADQRWIDAVALAALGLPQPVRRLLNQLREESP